MPIAAHTLWLYAATDLLACLTPGPAVLAVTSHALGGSIRATAGAIVGINLANMLWFALAGLGLSALVAAAPTLFVLLRWGGIAYLVWLGLRTWIDAHGIDFRNRSRAVGFGRGMLSAIAVQFSNPKALLFFTVFLPPFLDVRQPLLPQVTVLAMIGVVIEVTTLAGYSALAYRVGRLAVDERSARWIGRISGALLLGTAAMLASLSIA
jgi:homoserine/homoserine lactone efflux protein